MTGTPIIREHGVSSVPYRHYFGSGWGRLLVPITRNMGRMDGWYLCLMVRVLVDVIHLMVRNNPMLYIRGFKMYSIGGYRVEILPGNVFIIP